MTFDQKTARDFYKKLLAFYPREFRERFEESMQQTFNDLCRERKQRATTISAGFLLPIFFETFVSAAAEHLINVKKGANMENLLSNHKSAATIGWLSALPLTILLLIEISGVEPMHSLLKTLTTEGGTDPRLSAFGKVFLLSAIFLLPVGFTISLLPLARNARAGFGLTAASVNILITTALFVFIVVLTVGFIVDQYPCWISVPNCD